MFNSRAVLNIAKLFTPPSVVSVGIIATVFIIGGTFWFSSLFSYHQYIGWVSFIWMTAVPIQIILGVHLQFKYPKCLTILRQPYKGIAYLGISTLFMGASGSFLYFVPGGAQSPGPVLITATVITIVVVFWLVAAWKCWPFTTLTQQPTIQALLVFSAAHLIGYCIFVLFFNFSPLKNTPIYDATLDPNGFFNLWSATSFAVTTVAVLMVLSLFEFWPITRLSNYQPLLGIYLTVTGLLISSLFFFISVYYYQIDPVDFMVKGPISIIFGVFLVTNMMQFQLYSRHSQLARGVYLLVIAATMAAATQILYRSAIPYLTDAPLLSGHPTYETELWVASALLAITFPMINIVSGYFEFWPLISSHQSSHIIPREKAITND